MQESIANAWRIQFLEICMSKTKIVEKIVRFELFLTVIGQLCKSDQ